MPRGTDKPVMVGMDLMQVSHDVPGILQRTLMKVNPFQRDQKTRYRGTVSREDPTEKLTIYLWR
jgi:hypothetical protein